jgi:PAS domain-containing protein
LADVRQTPQEPSDAEALRATQARHSAVLDAAFDAIVTMDQGGRIIDFNRAAERTFGYCREDAWDGGSPISSSRHTCATHTSAAWSGT